MIPHSTATHGLSPTQQTFRRLLRNKPAVASAIFLLFMVAICFLLPLFPCIAPPNAIDLEHITAPCSGNHWLGTDHLGRDLLARILYGGRISLAVGFLATAVAASLGVIYGLFAGYIGGRVDAAMMRTIDVLFALPFIVVVVVFSLWIELPCRHLADEIVRLFRWPRDSVVPLISLVPLFLAIGALGWLTLARIVRSQALVLREQEFVLAARSLGLSHFRILFRHIAPNLLGTVIVYTSLAVPGIILTESTLSFIGLGVKPPNSSWGTLIKEGADRLDVAPNLLLFPSLFFCATLLALNFLGDGLRDALDPKT